MTTRLTRLNRVRVKNFKAICDSGSIKLTPLTVLIGNNGSGKSSLIDALETVYECIVNNIDVAMQHWRGIEHARNKAGGVRYETDETGELHSNKPISFELQGRLEQMRFRAATAINERGGNNQVVFENESIEMGIRHIKRVRTSTITRRGFFDKTWTTTEGTKKRVGSVIPLAESLLSVDLRDYATTWQFLRLAPNAMGQPRPQTRSRGELRLASDGSNLAEYLLDIRRIDPMAFLGILESLKYVLPYARDIQPAITSELERAVYLQLTEADYKIPGWLLSTGTLRVLALLACLRHPNRPSLLVIEEIENGLDPRTLHMLVEEMRSVVNDGRMQIIFTTHSPYLLDLLDLSQIVVVERIDGSPTFTRPSEVELAEWSKSFAPGRLYTMGRLTRGGK